ncbi:MAG: hypothetical protein M1826_006788 [Phylliscum demangeonii]|nr:MAG: hypothetical protein M1826_006788 [Phylliscum demangeonii]
MLARLFQATLRRSPPARFPVFDNLLINIKDMKVRGDAFNAIWLINLRVYVLQALKKRLERLFFARLVLDPM